MSKKILKRSLALGALMAFVITGNAWAEYNITPGVYNSVTFVGTYDEYKSSDSYVVEVAGGIVNVGDNVKINGGCISGGHSDSATTIHNNSVNIKGGEINSNIYGVEIAEVDVGFFNPVAIPVFDNKVNICGGVISGNTYSVYYFGSGEVEVKNNAINISGSANVENANLYGSNLTADKTEDNTLNISAWEGSIGSAQNFNVINLTEGASASFKTALNDANVAVNVNGATWNVDKASTVGSASFDASSVLNINGAIFEAKDGNNVYALNGSGELKVADGAILRIEGIDYKKYNVANGFNSIVDGNGEKFADGDEYWKLENTLMQGVWTTDSGLQVEIKEKEAKQLATEMGVSTSTAQSIAAVTSAAQVAIDKGIVANKEGTGAEKAVALMQEMAKVDSAVAGEAYEAVTKMAEAGGGSATAASIVKNVTGVTNDRLSFNCGHSAPHKGGHGVGLLEEGSGADVWVEYVHGKDSVDGMESSAGASSYEGKYNGIVMGLDFKKVNKFQSGIAFNYGEGDTNSVGSSARTKSEYDFWGIGYYGNIHNDDSNVIFDINYAKTDSDVTTNAVGMTYEASPETTTWTAGVKVEKLYQNENVTIVPYTGLRFMSIDTDDYSTKCGANQYKMERQDIWLLPVGVSIKQEVVNDNGWTVSPRVDLSYIWAFGDTDSNMEFTTLDIKTPVAYEVMDDGSWLGLVGIEAHKGQWGYGVSYSYQKGDHSTSKKWFVDVNYSF